LELTFGPKWSALGSTMTLALRPSFEKNVARQALAGVG